MIKFQLKKFLAMAPNSAISFSAKSAIIATTLSAAGRAFAGGQPSGLVPTKSNRMSLDFSADQIQAIKLLIESKMSAPDISEEEQVKLDQLRTRIENQMETNEIRFPQE